MSEPMHEFHHDDPKIWNPDLFAEVRKNPDDDAPRLRFAEWLEVNGRPDRAKFIRLEQELAQLEKEGAEDGEEAHALNELRYDLLLRHLPSWLLEIPDWARPLALGTARGYVSWVEGDARQLVLGASSLWASAPAQDLILHNVDDATLAALAALPQAARIRYPDL